MYVGYMELECPVSRRLFLALKMKAAMFLDAQGDGCLMRNLKAPVISRQETEAVSLAVLVN